MIHFVVRLFFKYCQKQREKLNYLTTRMGLKITRKTVIESWSLEGLVILYEISTPLAPSPKSSQK